MTEPEAERRPVSMPVSGTACAAVVCQPNEVVTVPTGGVVLLARNDTPSPVVAPAFDRLALAASPAIDTAIDDAGWGNVTDVTGGKPMRWTPAARSRRGPTRSTPGSGTAAGAAGVRRSYALGAPAG